MERMGQFTTTRSPAEKQNYITYPRLRRFVREDNVKPMQENQKPKNAPGPQTGGRPAKTKVPEGDVKAARVAALQYALDRAANFVHDGGSSYAARARGAARAGVPRATVDAGIAALEAALSDARAAVERAYAAPAAKTAPKARVTLGA
jgi:hypothetical protein